MYAIGISRESKGDDGLHFLEKCGGEEASAARGVVSHRAPNYAAYVIISP